MNKIRIMTTLNVCLVLAGLSVAQGRNYAINCVVSDSALNKIQPFSSIKSIELSDNQSYDQTRIIDAGNPDELIFNAVESKLSVALSDRSSPLDISPVTQITSLRSSEMGQREFNLESELITLTEQDHIAYVARYVHTAKTLISLNNSKYQVSLAVSELRSPKNASVRGRTAQLILTDGSNSTVRAELNCEEALDGESLGMYTPFKAN